MASDATNNINDLEQRLRADWAERDELIEEMRSLRYMETSPDVPVAMEAELVRTPLAHQIVERMVGTLTADPMTITVPPADETEEAQERSSRVERFLLAAVDQLEKQGDEDTIERFIESLVADGHGCMRMVHAPQLWRGFPRRVKGSENEEDYNQRAEVWKKGRPLPIAWNWIDPLTVYPLFGEFGLEALLETADRDVLGLEQHEGKWNVERPDLYELSRLHEHHGSGVVKFQQLWTRAEVIYAVEGEVVHRQKNPYGRPPYAYSFGFASSSREPGKMGLSALWPIRHLVPQLDRLLSQKATAVRMWCWPTVVVRQNPQAQQLLGDETGNPVMRSFEIAPGAVINLYANEDISFLTWTGNGPDADELIGLMTQFIERAGLSDAMYGSNPRGDSGYAINQLIAAARMRFKPVVTHAERAIEQQLATLLDIVEYRIKQPLHAFDNGKAGGWLSISPDDLNGYRMVRVNLNPIMPTDAYARSSKVINEVNARLKSRRTGMEEIGIAQPDDEEKRILVEDWKQRPEVQQWLVQEAIKRAGLKLAKGDMSMGQIQREWGEYPPALQQTLANQFAQTAPPNVAPEAVGMVPEEQIPPELMPLIEQLAQQMGMSVEDLIARLVAAARQMGVGVVELLQQLMERVRGGGTPGAAGAPGMGMPNPNVPPPAGPAGPGGPPVMAAPGVRANPTPPGPPPRLGRSTRPSGIATGRAPGTKRQGIERP